MSRLKLTQRPGTGKVVNVTPENAGWKYVGFDLHKLNKGDAASEKSDGDETCLVFISGKGNVTAGGKDLGELGERMSVFEGKPWSVYLPAGVEWKVEATSDVELAVCRAPSINGDLPVRVIGPDDLGLETRGKGANVRHVINILPEGKPADSLLVVEVITPGGNTSSYPPHKHDQDNLPLESFLEETYYHRINPPQGFAFQRVYTDKRSLDEACAVENHDVVMAPRGYHPVVAPHGYDLYYLNVMAGPNRFWVFKNDPQHEWMIK